MLNIKKPVFVLMAIGFLLGFTFTAAASSRSNRTSEQRQTLIHNGIERHYVIRVPGELSQGNGRVPLVLVLHGVGGNADNAEKITGFIDMARKEGLIVVYPEGTDRCNNKLLTWNAGHCCGYAMKNRGDDVGFLNALIDKLTESYPKVCPFNAGNRFRL
jgi:polyhydroxybutyrate depolymerase